MYNSAANDGKGNRANTVELEQESNTHREEEAVTRCVPVPAEGRTITESIQQVLFTSMAFPSAYTWARWLPKCNLQTEATLLGKFKATLTRGEKEIAEPMYIVKGHGGTALLSRVAAERMVLVEYQLELTSCTPVPVMRESQNATFEVDEEYNDVFLGLGELKGVKVRIQVEPDAKDAVQKQRRISLPLKDKFDEIIDKWEELDIIEDVGTEPKMWCSNVVLIPKKDRENIRASLDMTDAKKYQTCQSHLKRAGEKTQWSQVFLPLRH